MEHMDLIKMTPDAKKAAAAAAAASKKKNTDDKENNSSLNKSDLLDEEDFFDFITRFQSKRMDDQRCSLSVPSARGTYYIYFFFFRQKCKFGVILKVWLEWKVEESLKWLNWDRPNFSDNILFQLMCFKISSRDQERESI